MIIDSSNKNKRRLSISNTFISRRLRSIEPSYGILITAILVFIIPTLIYSPKLIHIRDYDVYYEHKITINNVPQDISVQVLPANIYDDNGVYVKDILKIAEKSKTLYAYKYDSNTIRLWSIYDGKVFYQDIDINDYHITNVKIIHYGDKIIISYQTKENKVLSEYYTLIFYGILVSVIPFAYFYYRLTDEKLEALIATISTPFVLLLIEGLLIMVID